MWHLTIRNLFARKLRLLTTSLAIALGVALFAGAQMLGATINKTFDDLFNTVYKSTDVVVQGPKLPGSDNRALVDESLAATAQKVDGVKSVSPYIEGYAQLVKADGKAVGTGGAPQFGANWQGNNPQNSFHVVDGAAPSSPNEVVIDKGVAKKGKLAVGNMVTVLSQNEPQQFKISGIAKFGSVDSPGGAQYVLFSDISTAQKYVGRPNKLTSISIIGNGTVSQSQLAERVRSVVPSPDETITGKDITKQSQEDLKKQLKGVTIFLEIFGLITLFVGAFIINNTFAILLAQRRREMALLRSIGARRRQVLNAVLAEAFLVGVIASLIGLVLGVGMSYGLQLLFNAFGAELPASGVSVPGGAIISALIAGTLVTVVSAYFPARRGSKVPPIAALRDVSFDDNHRSIGRILSGLVVLGLGVALFTVGLLTHMKKPYIAVGFGFLLTFVGVAMLGPIIARPASRFIGSPLPFLKGETGVLARENAMRNPKRTSATAAALMISVALITTLAVFFTSLKASLNESVDRSFHGDFIVGTGGFGDGQFSPALAQKLRQQKEVSVVAQERYVPSKVNSSGVTLAAVAPRDFMKLADPNVVAGNFNSLSDSQIAISKTLADKKNYVIGQRLKVEIDQTTQDLTIAAIYKDPGPLADYTVTLNTAQKAAPEILDSFLFVDKTSNTSTDQARRVVNSITAAYPTVKVQDQTEFKRAFSKQIDSVLRLFYAMLALAVIVSLLGIANTLALSVFERTRELGLLRAVGMTRRQVRSMVRWESVIVVLLGTVLGLVIGVGFGAGLVEAVKKTGNLEILAFPIGTVIVIVLVAAVAGVIAAILPARRAARLNILNAIATS